MKFIKFLFLLTSAIIATLACGVGDDLSTVIPANTPVEILTISPTVIPRQARTPIPTRIFLSPTSQALKDSTWVTDFSNPILVALNDQTPVFEDDFQSICVDEDNKWKECSTPEPRTYYQSNADDQSSISELLLATARPTLDLQPDLQDGYALLNKGWFFIVPESSKNPFYAKIDNGGLVLKLPEGKENKDFWIYNPRFLQKNFAIQFDLVFGETQPKDTFRFQFEQGVDQSFSLDLAKNKTWAFHWGTPDSQQIRSGGYEYFAPEPIRVLIIARENQCAVYLNNVPLDYFDDCRTDTNIPLRPRSTTFHILAEPGHSAIATMDNIKLWDLDKITTQPSLP